MSLKIGASVESRVSMIFKQTTHFAILLSLLGSRDGVGPVRGMSALFRTNIRLKEY